MAAIIRPVLNVMRRELTGYFSTPVAWVFIVIFLVLAPLSVNVKLVRSALLSVWRM